MPQELMQGMCKEVRRHILYINVIVERNKRSGIHTFSHKKVEHHLPADTCVRSHHRPVEVM